MKNLTLQFLLFVPFLILTFGCQNNNQKSAGQAAEKIVLFDGSNLDNFSLFVADSLVNPDTVWFVRDSVIRCQGNPFGYIQTKEEFSNYTLNVEWRWPENPGNSGVFLHKQGEDKLWPACIEAQLMDQYAGDFIAMGGYSMDQKADSTGWRIPKFEVSSEKSHGEWNKYTIACIGDSISVMVNGTLQNTGTGVSAESGKICLQSEGTPIEFRNIFLEINNTTGE